MFYPLAFYSCFYRARSFVTSFALFSAMEKIGQLTIKKNCKIAYLLALCIYDCDVLDANSVKVRCNCMSDLVWFFCQSLN